MDTSETTYQLVTSCTKEYLPGLIALNNSIKRNFPKGKLACFYYGDENEILPDGIDYLMNIPMPGPIIDNGRIFRQGLKLGPDMFARLLIPKFFTGRVFYVDCDCLILRPIQELWNFNMKGHPTACVYRPDIGWIGGHKHDDMASGTFVCDTEAWNRVDLVNQCFELMRKKQNGELPYVTFNVNVESVLSYMHQGKFYKLSPRYQNLTYYQALIKEDKVAHFAGPKPWMINGTWDTTGKVQYKKLWQGYYDLNEKVIKQETEVLPIIRPSDAFTRNRRIKMSKI